MSAKPACRNAVVALLAAGLILPVSGFVLWGLAGLLLATGDETGAHVVGWIARAVGFFWLLDLIGLVFVLAIDSLLRREDREEHEGAGTEETNLSQ